MKLNVNVSVEVSLTPIGVEALKRDREGIPNVEWDFDVKKGNRISWPLWELMRVFGPLMVMGASQVPFVDNAIEIKTDRERARSRRKKR